MQIHLLHIEYTRKGIHRVEKPLYNRQTIEFHSLCAFRLFRKTQNTQINAPNVELLASESLFWDENAEVIGHEGGFSCTF